MYMCTTLPSSHFGGLCCRRLDGCKDLATAKLAHTRITQGIMDADHEDRNKARRDADRADRSGITGRGACGSNTIRHPWCHKSARSASRLGRDPRNPRTVMPTCLPRLGGRSQRAARCLRCAAVARGRTSSTQPWRQRPWATGETQPVTSRAFRRSRARPARRWPWRTTASGSGPRLLRTSRATRRP